MTRCRRGNPRQNRRIECSNRPGARYEAPEAIACHDQAVDEGLGAVLDSTRRPDTGPVAHEEPEIQAADALQQTLEDVGMSAQIHPAQPPGFVEMGVEPVRGARRAGAAGATRGRLESAGD